MSGPEQARELLLEPLDVGSLNELLPCATLPDDLRQFRNDPRSKPSDGSHSRCLLRRATTARRADAQVDSETDGAIVPSMGRAKMKRALMFGGAARI
jgi:hypothetical protein